VSIFPLGGFPADRPAAIDDAGRRLSYGMLVEISEQLATMLPNSMVALVLVRNTLGCIAAIVALLQQRVVPVLLDANINESTARLYMSQYQPEVLIIPAEMKGYYRDWVCVLSIFEYVVLVAQDKLSTYPPHPSLALLLCTSGSTGSPKVVRLSRDNLLLNAEAIVHYLRITASDRPITSLPLHYTYGFSVLSSHLQAGATVLVTDRSIVEKPFWEFFKMEAGTSIAGVPYSYQMLKRLGFLKMDFEGLRTLTQAGGKMNPSLIREFAEYANRKGINFFVMYGQAEATARISYVPSELALEKAGSIGIAIPGGELFLKSLGLNDSSRNEGELGYRGGNVAMGYAECRADLVKGDEWRGTLLTGDLARRDNDGYYYIIGRLHRVIKLFGKRLNLDDLEQICLELLPEVACFGVEDRVTVCITASDHRTTLAQHLATRTGIHASAYQVRLVAGLPRTPSGKTDYQSLMHDMGLL
jgi:long-chain acyl-CoA synthetase